MSRTPTLCSEHTRGIETYTSPFDIKESEAQDLLRHSPATDKRNLRIQITDEETTSGLVFVPGSHGICQEDTPILTEDQKFPAKKQFYASMVRCICANG